jgi:lipopolysaccharide transport system permease protein
LLAWTFFATALSNGGQSLINQQNLLTKIYFPRLFVPTGVVTGGLVDLGISFGLCGLLLIRYQVLPPVSVVLVPLMILWLLVAGLGVAYTLSALTVTYRDFRIIVPFLAQIWMWLSAVIYDPTWLYNAQTGEGVWRYYVLALNPMVGVISGFRSAILGMPWHWDVMGISLLTTIGMFLFGLFYFRKTERRFADIA